MNIWERCARHVDKWHWDARETCENKRCGDAKHTSSYAKDPMLAPVADTGDPLVTEGSVCCSDCMGFIIKYCITYTNNVWSSKTWTGNIRMCSHLLSMMSSWARTWFRGLTYPKLVVRQLVTTLSSLCARTQCLCGRHVTYSSQCSSARSRECTKNRDCRFWTHSLNRTRLCRLLKSSSQPPRKLPI